MKNIKSKKAFTMIELVFTIVVIGILASVAIPRMAATRDDAEITKARITVASIRNALSMERQKRILRGNFATITAVGGTNTGVFGHFDDNSSDSAVLEYAVSSSTENGKWEYKLSDGEKQYIFHGGNLGDVIFLVNSSGKFVCKEPTSNGCQQLTE
jgi:general secretion pathway protein G